MSTHNATYWHALNLINPNNLWRFSKSAQSLGGPEQLLKASASILINSGVSPQAAVEITKKRIRLDPIAEMDKILRSGMQVLTHEDELYPTRLKEIHSSPPLIYVRGDASRLNENLLAYVGSRKITTYGNNVIKHLIPATCDVNVGVVSGLAYGVDATALAACLEHGGTAVAVLPGSLLYGEISPKANLQLARQIEERGCLVSENPPGAFVGKMHFPQRNRIVSALSLGVIVIEAGLKSGSLITAKLGLEQGKEIFAVPGSIFSPHSEGTLELIKRGARCVTSFQDIAQEFNWDVKAKQQVLSFKDARHELIHNCIAAGQNTIDHISKHSGLSSQQILVALTEMELNGALRRGGNGVYHNVR